MSDKPEPSNSDPASEGGVFGNLPDARPGTRSPRRSSAAKTKATTKAKTSAAKPKAKSAPPKAKPAPKAKPVAPPATDRPSADPPRPAAQQQPGGLADVAWAGIAVAAEAATIGVRLASRAIEAVRGNPERD